MIWINFLHFYQPANSSKKDIIEASEKSYWRVVRALNDNPNIKFTINISGCLFLRWEESGYKKLIDNLVKLVKKGQIELTGTAAYHPFLPLIPKEEAIEQIKENEEILKKYFGDNFKPKGFFIPEMAYSPNIAKMVKKCGYEWIVLDEVSHSGKLKEIDTTKVYLDKNSKLKVIFRSRYFSHGYFPDKFKEVNNDQTVITATDGELYGLRHKDPRGVFEKLLKKENLKTQTISEFIGDKKIEEEIEVIRSSWESTEEELKENSPYVLWYNKNNKTQLKIWEFADHVYSIFKKNKEDENYFWARWHLVRGLASCTFWWASEKDFRHVFGPQAWNPDEIEKRVNDLLKAVRSLEASTDLKTKIKTEEMAIEIKRIIWTKHWLIKEKEKYGK